MIVAGLLFHVGCLCVCLSVKQSADVHPSIFLFPDDNLSKYQLSFTKFGMCIDIVEIWFGIANGQVTSVFETPLHDSGVVLSFDIFIEIRALVVL